MQIYFIRYSGAVGKWITKAPWGNYEEYIEGVRIKRDKKIIDSIGQRAFYGLSKIR